MSLDVFLISAVSAVVLGYALAAVTAPVRVRLNHWRSADSGYEPCEGESPPPDVARAVAALTDLGFVVRGHWRLTGGSHGTGQVTLTEHPRTLDVAQVLLVTAGTRRHVTLLFRTRFEDGTEVATANNQVTAGLPTLPEVTALWLPELGDARALYRVHVQARDILGAGKKRLSVGPDAAAFLTAGLRRTLAHFVETGYYYFDAGRAVYRPTWKGAVLITWRVLRPVRPFYRARRRRRTDELLRELGIRPEPEESG